MTTTLSIIANPGRSTATPYGPLAYSYSLPSSSACAPVQVNWVHSLPDGAEGVTLEVQGGQTTKGQAEVMKALAELGAGEGSLGSTRNDSIAILGHLLSLPPFPCSLPVLLPFLSSLERTLTLRTYLLSPSSSTPTVADYAVWSSIRSNAVALAQLSKTPKQLPHLARWYSHLSARPECSKAVEDLTAQAKIKAPKVKPSAEASKEAPSANATFDLGLPNAVKGQVVTRLPPEPSGYLHIGHAKAAILNQYFARMYEGRFLIRFDDTNPSKEKAEFEASIIEDLALLGVVADSTSYTSDYFDQLQILCVQMIKEGKAYADDTEQELMRSLRMDGHPSPRRSLTPAESLEHFAEMATGSAEGLKWCIRAKISVDDPNKAMRDPVIYRCNVLPHHRTGTRYKIYPTYDFCCPIVDSLEGVTHALRTNEYRDRNPQYAWMLEALGMRGVEVWDFGRLGFVHTLLSKRKLKWFVEEGYVAGWDDPRFATVRGIRRRGMTIEAITQFMLLQGPSQAFTNLEWDSIWNINKKVIDPVAPRFVALEKEGLVKVLISGEGTPAQPEGREMPKHKKNPESGVKTTYFSDVIYVEQEDAKSFAQDEEITLMDWGNAFVRKIEGGSDSAPITQISMELNLTGDFKKTKKKITWLSSSSASAPLTPVTLIDYDYLITKKKLEEDDDVKDFLTPKTEFRVEAVADLNVPSLKKGDIIQFERKGFYIVDRASDTANPEQPAELIYIPDGKASSIASKYVTAQEAKKPAVTAAAAAAAAAAKGPSKKQQARAAKAAAAAGAVGGAEAPASASRKGAGGAGRIPEPAPLEPVQTTLLSNGKTGYEVPVNTKMFRVAPIYGEDGVEAPATTNMFKVKPVYDI